MSTATVFETRVRPRLVAEGDCLVWTGGKTSDGYGHLSIDGEETYTHRLAWSARFGPIPEGAHVLHRCDNPPCANADHLFIGDQVSNMRDMIAKGRLDTSGLQRRGEWTHCKNGHPLSGDNLYVTPSGLRECRTCKRARWQAYAKARR